MFFWVFLMMMFGCCLHKKNEKFDKVFVVVLYRKNFRIERTKKVFFFFEEKHLKT